MSQSKCQQQEGHNTS